MSNHTYQESQRSPAYLLKFFPSGQGSQPVIIGAVFPTRKGNLSVKLNGYVLMTPYQQPQTWTEQAPPTEQMMAQPPQGGYVEMVKSGN